MNVLHKLYFNTALWIATATVGITHAQCTDATIAAAHQGGWFIHANDTAARSRFVDNTLKIMPADERTLWGLGDRILAQPANDNHNEFVIVRSKNIKTSDYRPALGQFIRVIGLAKAQGTPIDSTIVLKITAADTEITAQDKLLPASCWVRTLEPTAAQPVTAPSAVPPAAKIIAFINESHIGEKNSLIVVDKGHTTGMVVGQIWSLVDELPNQPASAQAFGQAQILQVFDDISILTINHLRHEARLQTPLRYLP